MLPNEDLYDIIDRLIELGMSEADAIYFVIDYLRLLKRDYKILQEEQQ